MGKVLKFIPLCDQAEARMSSVGEIENITASHAKQTFRGYVLPHRNLKYRKFTDHDCNLYVPKRQWDAEFTIPKSLSNKNRIYEKLLDDLFWGSGEFADGLEIGPILFITGSVGSGKSTFVDYYLRCYCPNYSARRFSYGEKLVLHFDLKGRQTAKEADARIWRNLKKSLERAGIDPEEFGDFTTRETVDAEKIKFALEDISNALLAGGIGHYKYLVIVFDNIDQSPDACQKHCLTIIQDIVEEDSDIEAWRIIFPMWPETLNRLSLESSFASKGVEFTEIALGKVDLSEFYYRRREQLESKLSGSSDLAASKILHEVQNLTEIRYSSFLRDITYGNMVALDRIVIGLLLSDGIQNHQNYSRDHTLSDYRFFDSLVCGTTQYHSANKSNILNPFGWKKSVSDPHQIFIIPYLFQYLDHEAEHKKDTIEEYFFHMGFKTTLTREALKVMARYNLIHIEDECLINPHRNSIAAYLRFINEPAVVDNFAHTTPVLSTHINKGWVKTKGYHSRDFLPRSFTTIKFFEAMAQAENIIDSGISASSGSLAIFRDRVDRWTGKARYQYNNRLEHLKRNGWPIGAKLTEDDWKELFS